MGWAEEQKAKRDREEAQEAAAKAALPLLLRQVIPLLSQRTGRTWTLVEGDRGTHHLEVPGSDIRLGAEVGGWGRDRGKIGSDRVRLWGCLPSGERSRFYRHDPSITVALTRPPGAVANEITSRVLPKYLEALDKGQREWEAYQTREAQRRQVLHRLAAALQQPVPVADSTADRDSTTGWCAPYQPGRSGISILAKVESDALVEVKFRNLPEDLAAALLELAAAWVFPKPLVGQQLALIPGGGGDPPPPTRREDDDEDDE